MSDDDDDGYGDYDDVDYDYDVFGMFVVILVNYYLTPTLSKNMFSKCQIFLN